MSAPKAHQASAPFQTPFIVSTRHFLSSARDFSVNNSIFATSSSVTTPKYGVLIFAYYYYTHSGKRNCTRPSIEGSLKLYNSILYGGGGPTPFLYMATRFLPNVHDVQKCTKMYKIGFFMFGSSLDRFTCCG